MASSTTTTPFPPLHTVLPPLLLGTATFNTQYVSDPFSLPAPTIIARALDLGITGFDTSPYYGPSETILGAALAHPSITSRPGHARSSYFLVTKAGRIAAREFDYSPAWIRASVKRSLERLGTPYLDLVYAHDVEFVSDAEVLDAVRELRRLRDEEGGLVRYVGISGYPVDRLCALAELVLRETGEPLDAVLSYAHFTVQNGRLGSEGVLKRLVEDARVGVVLNASMLGMGLLTTRGAVDGKGPVAQWHPGPEGLRRTCHDLVRVAEEAGEKLEVVAIRWALENWARVGAVRGTSYTGAGLSRLPQGKRVGVSVMGITSVAELEETCRVFQHVVEDLESESPGHTEDLMERRKRGRERSAKVQAVVAKMWDVLGEWKDYSWSSPEPGFVNTRKAADVLVIPDEGASTKPDLEDVAPAKATKVSAML